MVFCPNCGAENPDDATFCKNCGTKLVDVARPTKEEKSPEEKEGWGTKKKMGAVASGFLIFLIIVGILLLAGPMEGKKEPNYHETHRDYYENFQTLMSQMETTTSSDNPEWVNEWYEEAEQGSEMVNNWKWDLQDIKTPENYIDFEHHLFRALSYHGQVFNIIKRIANDGKISQTEYPYLFDIESLLETGRSKMREAGVQSLPPKIEFEIYQYSVNDLKIEPKETMPNEKITISVRVHNESPEIEATPTLVLKVEGEKEGSRTVTLAGGETKVVKFSVWRTEIGAYDVELGGLRGRFRISGIFEEETSVTTSYDIFKKVTIRVYKDKWQADVRFKREARSTYFIYDSSENLVHETTMPKYSTQLGGTWSGYIPSGKDGYIQIKAWTKSGTVEWWPSENRMYRIDR